MSTDVAVPPQVLWAQRKNEILLTFSTETKDPVVKIEAESIYFKGTNVADKKTHEVTISLHDKINPEKSTYANKGRVLEMVLRKEKSGPYWPNLTKDKKKPHYLKIDFNKWKDEDDDEEMDSKEMDIEEMLKAMGGVGGAGGGDNPDKPSFDDLESDSDDENLPDLE